MSRVRRIILALRAVSASRAVGSPHVHVWKHIAYSCSPGLAISRKNFCCFSWAWYPGLSSQFPGRLKQEDHTSMACQGYIASSRPGWAIYPVSNKTKHQTKPNTKFGAVTQRYPACLMCQKPWLQTWWGINSVSYLFTASSSSFSSFFFWK